MFARVESRHNRINVTSMENFIVLSFSQKPKKPRQGIRVNRCLKLAGENPPLKGALGIVFEGIQAITFNTQQASFTNRLEANAGGPAIEKSFDDSKHHTRRDVNLNVFQKVRGSVSENQQLTLNKPSTKLKSL